uniref:Uncharacterized protein n=1 Tax=Fagus sylvatica TaxID=28930 RepID=A0A2N9GUI5_FAGSY
MATGRIGTGMGDPTPPRTTTINNRPRPAPMVGATYPAPLPNRHAPYCPAPPRKSSNDYLLAWWLHARSRIAGGLRRRDTVQVQHSSACFALATKRWISTKRWKLVMARRREGLCEGGWWAVA